MRVAAISLAVLLGACAHRTGGGGGPLCPENRDLGCLNSSCEPDYKRGCDICRCATAGEARSGGSRDYSKSDPPKTGGDALQEAVLGCATAPGAGGALVVLSTVLALRGPVRRRARAGRR